ncbi:SRPBCC family protein [Paludibacterium yongneupense]|uniref:SRPBCC family protein n=1 Tax=Paludibacterium yongneupense TaxID=400061 RepID=UPI001C046B17|nr:SRPBCC family protein [Paludibacterium yongneupense]
MTTWRIDAPLEQVFEVVADSLSWPDWWPSLCRVEQMANGNADGVGNVRRYTWQGRLPYRVAFEVRATLIKKREAIDGIAQGDLEGVGRWKFSRQGRISVVRYEWHVQSTRRWMNLIAPVARSMFIRNHARIMAQGGRGLARRLGSSLVSQETIDLMAQAFPSKARPGRRWKRGQLDLMMAFVTGLGAGAIVIAAQFGLWWLAAMPLPETFFRDVRLTAAMVMGTRVLLPPPSTASWDILLVATLIHFTLSIVYAVIPAHLAGRLRLSPFLIFGAVYGWMIYVVNLYGFTLLFPWFAVARDGVTLAAHLVFGVTLVAGCRLFVSRSATNAGIMP